MTNQLTLRSIDIPSIHKFAVGFDRMFDELSRNQTQQTNYTPYNIVQMSEDEYMISVAVAGFGLDNLTVTKDKNFLVIEGIHAMNHIQTDAEPIYLHKGISERDFRREFRLADHVEIENAHLELGILSIHLKREVPEEQKPKNIAISFTK